MTNVSVGRINCGALPKELYYYFKIYAKVSTCLEDIAELLAKKSLLDVSKVIARREVEVSVGKSKKNHSIRNC